MCPDKHETTNTLEMEWGKQASFTLQTFFKIGSMCMEAGLRNSSEPRMYSFAGYFLLYYRRIPTGEAVCIARLAAMQCRAGSDSVCLYPQGKSRAAQLSSLLADNSASRAGFYLYFFMSSSQLSIQSPAKPTAQSGTALAAATNPVHTVPPGRSSDHPFVCCNGLTFHFCHASAMGKGSHVCHLQEATKRSHFSGRTSPVNISHGTGSGDTELQSDGGRLDWASGLLPAGRLWERP